MNQSHLIGALSAFTFVLLANTAHAAVVNPILGLDIGGTLYNVTFHDATGDSFNSLWDADDDGIFGGGASVFSVAPTFWGNNVGAATAATSIIAALGNSDQTTSISDSFIVPWGTTSSTLGPGTDLILGDFDSDNLPTVDNQVAGSTINDFNTTFTSTGPFASFAVVPVPAAVWLFASGLVGLFGLARRKTRT